MSYGIVYELLCKVTGLRYIGQTISSISTRWQGHCKLALKGDCDWEISKAIREHGKQNFQLRILCECNSKQELNVAERKFITDYRTVWPGGYNMTNGGEGPCEITRQKISERTKLAMQNPDLRKKLSKLARERSILTGASRAEAMRQANCGRNCSDITRAKISKAHQNKPSPMRKCIIQLDENEKIVAVYAASCYVAIALGMRKKSLNGGLLMCCLGRRKFWRGFQWHYADSNYVVDNGSNLTTEQLNLMKQREKYPERKRKCKK